MNKHSATTQTVQGLDLSGIEGNGWMAVYDGLTMAAQGLEGIAQRPQCQRQGDLNAAGKYLMTIADFLLDERRRAMEVLLERPHSDEEHVELMVKLQWLAVESNGEDMAELKRFVSDAAERRDIYVEKTFGKEARA